jgi:hypothetical protein
MASTRDLAISLADIVGWTNIPQANDHYRAHPTEPCNCSISASGNA